MIRALLMLAVFGSVLALAAFGLFVLVSVGFFAGWDRWRR